MTIFIDHRENKSGVPRLLKKMNVPITVTELEVGDYIVGEIAVERKTIGDYLGSKTSGHLDDQLYNLSTNFEFSYLLIEGYVSQELLHRKMKRAPFISSLVGSSLKHAPNGKQGQIVTVNLETKWDTVLFLKFLHDKVIKGEARLPKIFKRKANPDMILVYVVSSVPGIGQVYAKRLLGHCKTVARVMNADVLQLTAVIGKKRASNVHNLLNKIYEG